MPIKKNEERNKMQEDNNIDQLLTQHAIYKIMSYDIIPCFCGAYRKVIQSKDKLLTQCSKCNSQDPFSIADLTIIGGALLKLAIDDSNSIDLKTPDVDTEEIYQMIEDLQDSELKDAERQEKRIKLKLIKGGLSKKL